MKLASLATLCVLLCASVCAAQANAALRILLTQDGANRTASVRTAATMLMREMPPGANGSGEMKAFQALTFVVPRGLHAGESARSNSLSAVSPNPH